MLPNLRSSSFRHSRGFTLMEILVVIAIILVLAAIAMPVYSTVRQRTNKGIAVNIMRQLASAAASYTAQNDGELPREDSAGTDNWQAAADPVNDKAWYNALPRLVGAKTVGEYASSPRDFYTKENLLYLPGAAYPNDDKKLVQPLFAVAINTKLQRKNAEGQKGVLKYMQIANPSKTVLFLEQGLPDENKTHRLRTQNKYDGSCKGSARSFVGRYGGQGVLCFVDGHIELAHAEDLLTETGRFPFPPDQIIWTKTPDEDPNK